MKKDNIIENDLEIIKFVAPFRGRKSSLYIQTAPEMHKTFKSKREKLPFHASVDGYCRNLWIKGKERNLCVKGYCFIRTALRARAVLEVRTVLGVWLAPLNAALTDTITLSYICTKKVQILLLAFIL